MKRWRTVTTSELQRLWDAQRKSGVIFNGCTHAALVKRYGKNVKHIPGCGWFKLTKARVA